MWTLAAALLLASVGLFASSAKAQAETTLIKNLSQTPQSNLAIGALGSNHQTVAVRFETGSHEGGYALTSVTINAENNIASDDSPRVSIYSAASGSDPDPNASVYTLTNPSSFGAGNLTFTAPADATLEKDTKYFVVVESAVDGGFYHVNATTSDSVDSMAAGWSLNTDRHFRTSDSGSWDSATVVLLVGINVSAILSPDATLSALALADGDGTAVTLRETFDKDTTSYTASVAQDVDEITITPTATHSNASFEYLDAANMEITDTDTSTDALDAPLSHGSNTFKVKVTAEDGVTTETYTVDVTRAPPGVVLVTTLVKASGIQANVGGSAGQARAQKFTVESSHDYTLTGVTIDADAGAGVEVAIYSVMTGSDNPPLGSLYDLTTPTTTAFGNRTFIAPANATLTKGESYFVVVTGPSTEERAASLTASNDETKIDGWTVDNGSRSRASGSWSPSTSTLRMELTGTVHPPATLSDLVLEDADDNTIALTPTFDTETTSYTASVGNLIDEITITPTGTDSAATFEYLDAVNNAIMDANTMKAGQQVSLAVGGNTINVKVTAEDDFATETYMVVTRAPDLPVLSFASNNINVDEDAGSVVVTVNLAPVSAGTVTVD